MAARTKATKAELLDIIRRLRSAVAAEASGGRGMPYEEIHRALDDADRVLGRPPRPPLPDPGTPVSLLAAAAGAFERGRK